jgi:hypothetical protein
MMHEYPVTQRLLADLRLMLPRPCAWDGKTAWHRRRGL